MCLFTCQLQAADELTDCLLALGRSSAARSFLIRHILSQISSVANQLLQACQVGPAPQTAFFFCCCSFPVWLCVLIPPAIDSFSNQAFY